MKPGNPPRASRWRAKIFHAHIFLQSVASRRQNCRGRARRTRTARRAAANGGAGTAAREPRGKGRCEKRFDFKERRGFARRAGGIGKHFIEFSRAKSFGEGTGEFHPAAFQFARGGRAVEPRAGDSDQGSLVAGGAGKVEKNSRSCGGW